VTNEEREALKRLRNLVAAGKVPGIMDIAILTDMALREHPADDDEPITDEWWLETFNAIYVELTDDFMLYLNAEGKVILHAEGTLEHDDNVYWMDLTHVKTRGDVRRLCAVLGIGIEAKVTV